MDDDWHASRCLEGNSGHCKTVQWSGIDIYTVVNGKIEALDRAADSLELLKQLGALLTWQDKVIQ